MFLLIAAAAAAEERIVLDAAEKHIVREAYHASRAVTLQGRDVRWSIYAGAAIDARRIDLKLDRVRGEVRYRADSSRLDALLQRHRAVVAEEPR